jgi:hypothetical protein
MNKRVTIYTFATLLFGLTLLVSESPVLAQDDTIPEMTLTAISELGGRHGESDYAFDVPWALEVDEENNLYILDANNSISVVSTSDGRFLRQIGCAGSGKGEFDGCWDFALDREGRIYVADDGNSRVQIVTQMGGYIGEFAVAHRIRVIEVGPAGKLYVNSDLSKSKRLVCVLSPEGELLSSILDIMPDDQDRENVTLALNQFRMSFDHRESILLGRQCIALFEKYDGDPEPVFRIHLDGPEIDHARAVLYQNFHEAFEKIKARGRSKVEDFVEDVVFACSDGYSHGVEYISDIRSYSDDYYLLIVGVIYVYDQGGNLLRKYRLRDKDGNPVYVHRICFDGQGALYGLDTFETSKCYKFRIIE